MYFCILYILKVKWKRSRRKNLARKKFASAVFCQFELKSLRMELDPMDERELYNKHNRSDNTVSTTISTIVVQGGPLQLVIALLRVRICRDISTKSCSGCVSVSMSVSLLNNYRPSHITRWMQISFKYNVALRHEVLIGVSWK